jgi:hypothetical protein
VLLWAIREQLFKSFDAASDEGMVIGTENKGFSALVVNVNGKGKLTDDAFECFASELVFAVLCALTSSVKISGDALGFSAAILGTYVLARKARLKGLATNGTITSVCHGR